jgi:hypothetical protein
MEEKMDWFDDVKSKYIPEIYGIHRLAKELGKGYTTIYDKIDKWKRNDPEGYARQIEINKGICPEKSDGLTEQLLKDIQRETTIKYLCDKHKISERLLYAALDELQDAGYQIYNDDHTVRLCNDIIPQDNRLKCDWSGDKIIRFGLCGDPQFNSKYVQITHLHKYYDMLQREGITVVYNAGDMDEGEEMRPGHKYECYNQGADDHVDEIVKNYPSRPGMETFFITGNHDHSLIKRAGLDIGKQIAEKRKDMKYIGMSAAVIELTPNCTLELRHPLDGTAYAISYKIQKMIDAMQGGEKPSILAVGHYHKSEYLFYRNIHAIQTGCFQAQTPWMKGKQIAAMVGGWIIEAHVDDEGHINRFKQEFIPFYKMVKEDYLNWR